MESSAVNDEDISQESYESAQHHMMQINQGKIIYVKEFWDNKRILDAVDLKSIQNDNQQ